MPRRRFDTVLFLALGLVGTIGCNSSEPVITSPSQLKPQTEQEIKISKDMDTKINEEEGASFGARNGARTAPPRR